MKAFVVDLSRCNGCHNCQIVCKDEHVDNAWPAYAAPQPDTGQFWIGVEETVHGSTPKVKLEYAPRLCNHCSDAACMKAASNDAVYRRDDGLVIIDPDKARGQKAIAEACPYGAVFWNDDLDVPQKCTGCAHLLDSGWEVPRCVEACATEALRFMEEDEIASVFPDAQPLAGIDGCAPRVYYAHPMKKFIAGTLFDPEKMEVVVGARVALLDAEGSEIETVETDGFGDFWFKGLDDGLYTATARAEGFSPYGSEKIKVGASCNLGDIPLQRQ